MSEHTVSRYDDELKDIARRIAEMGGMAERLVDHAVTALTRLDTTIANSVISDDKRLDLLQRECEEQAILIIARRQPMAMDLREVIGALRISNDLERIGDLAKNIAKRVIALDGQFQSKRFMTGVEHMAELSLAQLKDVLDAYALRDVKQAFEVWKRDAEIDQMYTSLFRELLTYMMEDPRNITFCTHLLFCAKNIERIGDHTTNIAETIQYAVTGELLPDERPKHDDSSITTVPYETT
ncbi:phosphate signaling complex protein PhoU [Kaistia dalseonensis]|uniref:Phosphate-specific transport system accessory protein PhoU n=1 Tax=Kaistia dalseonensis TaxID=410840 RepID=A0ABU0HDL2_9HYPH|nr:phosphate signaling complex protein PhoU [Kaistia dalseonensis]MCX5497762.1 phosphate signaling complex protein PhoU [Kaistia dalseonensis]MDQ0440406.1 phosphate transport system protein [Kaistia dalseonensis]